MLSKAFYDAVESNEVRMIRIMMKDSLLLDLSFKQFDEMESIASKKFSLYEPHDGRELIWNKSQWNDDYMNKLKVQVISNFSHERVDLLKAVIRYLRPLNTVNENTSNKKSVTNRARSYQEQKKIDQKKGNYREAKIASGVVVGAVVGGTIAAATSVTVLSGAAVGAVVGGTVAAVATNDK